jgi:heat shock protein HslJ
MIAAFELVLDYRMQHPILPDKEIAMTAGTKITSERTVLPGFVLLLFFIAGCAQVGQIAGTDSAPLIINAGNVQALQQREWDLRALKVDGNQMVIDVDTKITLRFQLDGQVVGLAAVNRLTGSYSFSSEGNLNWGKAGFAITRRSGPPELMEKEQVYLRGLAKTNVAVLARHTLQLQSEDSATLLTFNESGY